MNITCDREKDDWTAIPVGVKLTKLARLGELPVQFSGACEYHFATDHVWPAWAVNFTVKFLFPLRRGFFNRFDRRQEREARVKEKANFWSLSAVTSAQIVSGTEVFACVELRDSPSDTPEAFTINLSQAQRIDKTFIHFMPAGHVPSGPAQDAIWYLYPLQNVLKGCVRATGESPFPVAELKAVGTVAVVEVDPTGQLLRERRRRSSRGVAIRNAAADHAGRQRRPDRLRGRVFHHQPALSRAAAGRLSF